MARRVDVEPSCPACSDQEETDLHLFFFSMYMYFSSLVSLRLFRGQFSVIEWLAFVFQTHDMEPIARIFMLLCGYGGPEINWFEKIISSS